LSWTFFLFCHNLPSRILLFEERSIHNPDEII
jgi:hypothetical protein